MANIKHSTEHMPGHRLFWREDQLDEVQLQRRLRRRRKQLDLLAKQQQHVDLLAKQQQRKQQQPQLDLLAKQQQQLDLLAKQQRQKQVDLLAKQQQRKQRQKQVDLLAKQQQHVLLQQEQDHRDKQQLKQQQLGQQQWQEHRQKQKPQQPPSTCTNSTDGDRGIAWLSRGSELAEYYDEWERQLHLVLDPFYGGVIRRNFVAKENELLKRKFEICEREKLVVAKETALNERTKTLSRAKQIIRQTARRLVAFKDSMRAKEARLLEHEAQLRKRTTATRWTQTVSTSLYGASAVDPHMPWVCGYTDDSDLYVCSETSEVGQTTPSSPFPARPRSSGATNGCSDVSYPTAQQMPYFGRTIRFERRLAALDNVCHDIEGFDDLDLEYIAGLCRNDRRKTHDFHIPGRLSSPRKFTSSDTALSAASHETGSSLTGIIKTSASAPNRPRSLMSRLPVAI